MAAYGFNPKPSGQSFYRATTGGRWAFHISFIRHESDVDVTADVAVRIDAIEEVVNECDAHLTDAEKRRSVTLGAELGNLSRGRFLRWTVSELEEVTAVADQITRAFEKIALPYLASNLNVESAYRLLTGPPPEDRLHSPILGARSMRAVAAAHLLGFSSERDQLIQRYETQLVMADDPYLPSFHALIKALGLR